MAKKQYRTQMLDGMITKKKSILSQLKNFKKKFLNITKTMI